MARTSPPGARQRATAGRTLVSEMKETSIVASEGSKGRSAAVSSRALSRSIKVTRGSSRRRRSIWP
jgi:hypothetical protein